MTTDYGKRLKQARKYARLSQAALAERVGIKQPTVSDLEKEGNGSAYTAQMAVACSVNGRWLATGEGDMLDTSSHDVPAMPDSHGAPTLSPEAVDLAMFFDMLTDKIDRAIVQNVAMTEILRLLAVRAGSSKVSPTPAATPIKQVV